MNREVVDPLLRLLDERVAEDLPGQFFGLAIDFFESLVDRYRPDRYRAVANDPLARFMDVLPGRQIITVSPPSGWTKSSFDFFLNARTKRRVTDVGVDLGKEVAAMIIGSLSG
jgi:hypothetical protein